MISYTTGDCGAVDCPHAAVIYFRAFRSVERSEKKGLHAVFAAAVPLCYPHYRQAVQNELRYWRNIDKSERKAKRGK